MVRRKKDIFQNKEITCAMAQTLEGIWRIQRIESGFGMDKAQYKCEHEKMGIIGRAPGNFRKW